MAVALFALALLVGLTPGTSIWLFPVAAVAGVLFGSIPGRDVLPQVVGSALFGVLSLLAGLSTGFGVLEVAGVVGAIAGALLAGRSMTWG
ncbi:MAG: hypothetical protein WAL25_05640, partial [Acidimicrobiia bacterium]